MKPAPGYTNFGVRFNLAAEPTPLRGTLHHVFYRLPYAHFGNRVAPFFKSSASIAAQVIL
jgi:hypothetical protein